MKIIRILIAALFVVVLGSMTILTSTAKQDQTRESVVAEQEPQSVIYDRVNDRMDPTRDYGGPIN